MNAKPTGFGVTTTKEVGLAGTGTEEYTVLSGCLLAELEAFDGGALGPGAHATTRNAKRRPKDVNPGLEPR